MKYLLPFILTLLFTACSDSGKTVSEKQATTPIEKSANTIALEKVEPKPAQDVAKIELTGEVIFNQCKTCHGNSAEKKALGTSQIIKGWDRAKLEQVLHGYKAGTYGAKMKSTMEAQVKNFSDEDITNVATYIHSL